MPDLLEIGDKMRLLPLDVTGGARRASIRAGQACWSAAVACAPAPLMALRNAILARMEKAKAISEK